MIGVLVNSAERAVVTEFFELFKTPWEFYQNGRSYDVLLCSGIGRVDDALAKLTLVYSGRPLEFDAQEECGTPSAKSTGRILYRGTRLPIYGDFLTFADMGSPLMVDEKDQPVAIELRTRHDGAIKRIGYNLFSEIATLLTAGQPPENSLVPALDLHIALLQDMILASGIPLMEVPPVPHGYDFIACLTHDVDHPSMRIHKWDHTMLGFLFRSTLGSLGKFFRGRFGTEDLCRNWFAALKLPLVHLGIAKDFWSGFETRYAQIEGGIRSTFFIIPFKGQAGQGLKGGVAPKRRASGYGAEQIAGAVKTIMAAGCEVGLHGIDAWVGTNEARHELQTIQDVTQSASVGVRMHWLYSGDQTLSALEASGAAYDSTVGYRETVGYRAGTAQPYKPLEVQRLLEFPMHVMDTALFYPDYLGLSFPKASQILNKMVDHSAQSGGCLTVNWHDRSLAPERLWTAPYRDLLSNLKNRNPWFATLGEANAWFQMRRSVKFGIDPDTGQIRAEVGSFEGSLLPGLRVRTHRRQYSTATVDHSPLAYTDEFLGETAGERVLVG